MRMSTHVSPQPPPRRRRGRVGMVAMIAAGLVAALPGTALADEPGASNTITDVPGVKVGHHTRIGDGYQTGTTVVLTEDGATASSTTFGGAPGTKETDLLEPGGLVTEAHAIVLSGGSAYGLDTTTGVMQWLEERGHGFPVGQGVVPIVPAAILFDLGRGGDFAARPDAAFGYAAADAATTDPVEMGRVGAGTGASWGLGSASVVLDNGYTVGAIVGLNPGGSPVNPDTCLPYGVFLELGNEFNLAEPTPADCPARRGDDATPAAGSPEDEPFNTTIAVVATDAPLDQTQAQRMSMVANSGLSRSIKPVHNMFDGDTVFAISTADSPGGLSTGELNGLYNAAADAVGRAIVHALLEGETFGNRISYCDQYPSACRFRDSNQDQSSQSEDGAAVPAAPADPGDDAVVAAAAAQSAPVDTDRPDAGLVALAALVLSAVVITRRHLWRRRSGLTRARPTWL